MFNQTPHINEWYSSLIVVKSGTTLISFDIYVFTQVRKDCQTTSSSFFPLALSLINLLGLQAVTYPFIHWINIVYYFYLVVFNCPTDVQKKNITLPIVFSCFFPMHLSCISDLLRLSWFERTTQFAFSSSMNDLSCISSLHKERMLVGCH
jgi:hypothetical protein